MLRILIWRTLVLILAVEGRTLMEERIQKLISAAGLMSRRAAEKALSEGRVSVNGKIASLGDKADINIDEIRVDGVMLPSTEAKVYIMLNKPKGYVCTLSDEKGRKNVTELVKELGTRVYPVGRLDMYSEGLLIMTNDGEFANKVMHPSHEISKTYLTWVEGEDIGLAMEYLRCPMEIDGYVISPAEVELHELYSGGAVLAITIHEGRNRQVRKMCELVGLKVRRLLRISEGGLGLGELKSGSWRHLSPEEIKLIISGEEK